MTKTRKYLIVGSNIAIHTEKGLVSINKSHGNFDRIKSYLQDGKHDKALKLIDKSEHVNKNSGGRIKVINGVARIDGDELPNTLSEYVKELIKDDKSLIPVIRFWSNLKQNPDPWEKNHPGEGVRPNLFKFLHTKGIQLTKDGCFIAYKYVGDNYKDSYTGQFDNHVGNKVTMKRSDCNHDPNASCSAGLHVGAWDYVKGSSSHIMEVKVNPKDVVSIPYDYNCQKMRTCGYEVVGEYGVKDEPLVGRLHDHKRTYYYKSSGRDFDPRNVTSHKVGDLWNQTVRAKNTKEAVRKFRVLYKRHWG